MREQGKTAFQYAAHLKRSVTYARSVLAGWLPRKEVDAEFVVRSTATFLEVEDWESLLAGGVGKTA